MEKNTHLIKDTNIEVEIRKVSPMLMNRLAKDFPPPKPPVEEHEINGEIVREENPTNPEYLKEYEEYEDQFNEMVQRILMKRGVVFEMTPERQKEVDQLRQDYLDETGIEIEEKDDRFLWLYEIAIGTPQDLQELMEAIYSRQDVQEEDLRIAEDSFQG